MKQESQSEKLAKLTRRMNELRREARAKGIVSPYRQSVYVQQQLKKERQ